VPEPGRSDIARQTLVIACCAPAARLLAAELGGVAGIRPLVLPRSCAAALERLALGLVRGAGVHLAASDQRDGNAGVVRRATGPGKRLLRVARWEEGLTLAPSVRVRSVQSVLRSRLSWVGREPGSGARQCLDELLHDRAGPRRIAYDHRGVVEAIRCGWAQVGVCVRLVSAEAGQQFLSVREEGYDLCYAAESERDPRVQALVRVVRSTPYRRAMADLPGYSTVDAGEIQPV
jgi:molybdate-binding protein